VKLSDLKGDTRDNLPDQKFPTKPDADKLSDAAKNPPDTGPPTKKRKNQSPVVREKWAKAVSKLGFQNPNLPHDPKNPELKLTFDLAISYTNKVAASGKKRPKSQSSAMGSFSATDVRELYRSCLLQYANNCRR
jgi:hypothetical protein